MAKSKHGCANNFGVAVILADGAIDSLLECGPHARDHVADLRRLGHRVSIAVCDSWKEADAWEDHFNGVSPSTRASTSG